jgi:hypothetical protein
MIINRKETKTPVFWGDKLHHNKVEQHYETTLTQREIKFILSLLDKVEGEEYRLSVDLATTIRGSLKENREEPV